MAKARDEDPGGWDIAGTLARLRAETDPYIREQGLELFRRGAAEDFAILAGGTIQVRVADPRDSRSFPVTLERKAGGHVRVRCPCPYRLHGRCRHQIVALEYLRAVAEDGGGGGAGGGREASGEVEAAAGGSGDRARAELEGPALYRLFGAGSEVATRPDGSLLRLVLHELGSPGDSHRVGLQLFTGTGWTEARDRPARWIDRGPLGPHPRDALLAARLDDDGRVRSEVDSDTLAALLAPLAGSAALVDRSGSALEVSPWPLELAARIERAEEGGVAARLFCRPGCGAGGSSKPGAGAGSKPGAGSGSSSGREVPLEEVWLVPASSPWVQLESGELSALVAGASGPELAALALDDLSSLRGEALDRFLREGLSLLERAVGGRLEIEEGLIREVEGVDGARLRLEGTVERLAGRLELSYGGDWMVAPESPEPWTVERDGEVRRFPPAGQSLARAASELGEAGFRREGESWVIDGPEPLRRALERRPRPFVAIELPASLESLDLVSREPALRLRVGAGEGGGDLAAPFGECVGGEGGRLVASGGFGALPPLQASFALLDGERELSIDLERLAEAAREDPSGALALEDGTVLSLRWPAVRRLVELAGRSGPAGRDADRLELSLASLSELLEEEPGRAVEFDRSARSLVESLRHGEDLPLPELPPRLEEILRPYQKEAVRWFSSLGRWGLGGLLADEMGLGKTVMALARLFGSREAEGTGADEDAAAGPLEGQRLGAGEGAGAGETANERDRRPAAREPVLVVSPTSLAFNWIEEARRFFPEVEAASLQGRPPSEREEILAAPPDLLVTSYALLRRDRELLGAGRFRAVVLDEAQNIKNPRSRAAAAAFSLRARERWCLTGTPIENRLTELWSLFEFLLPGHLGSEEAFRAEVVEPIRSGDEAELGRLRRRVRPFVLRRTKESVLPDLPPRIEQVERAVMSAAQATLYREVLSLARRRVEGKTRSGGEGRARLAILAALTRLRQICCHPALLVRAAEKAAEAAANGERASSGGGEAGGDTILEAARAAADEAAADPGGKFELLGELLGECVEEGHRVLLFSQFTTMLDLIEERLDREEIRHARLDGSTRDRERVIRRFRSDAGIPVFLISLKAGGHGLNLTEADTVILYDPWWNPAVEEQAAARAHRLGQTVPVHIHKLIARGTIEERILELQAAKKHLAESVIAAEDPLGALGLEDLRALLFT